MGKNKRKKSNLQRNELKTEEEYDEDYAHEAADILDRYASELLGEDKKIQNEDEEVKQIPKTLKNEENETQNVKKGVEVVVFKSRKKNSNNSAKATDNIEYETENEEKGFADSKLSSNHLNSSEMLERLKFDVGLFGMKGFSKEEQRKQERMRAIKLGAVAPKRKYVNYKVLMEQRKRAKEDKDSSETRSKKTKVLKSEKKNPVFWTEGKKAFTPQIGKFKDGVLKLSSKDIRSVNKRR